MAFAIGETLNKQVPHLKPSIECPLDRNTLARVRAIRRDGCDEGVQLILLLLQFLNQALYGSLSKCLAFTALPMAHQAVHDAQACIVACRRVGDGHGDLCAALALY